jgi:NTP pyrophosphatase (non-canonical NTP hydrolase)
MYSPDPDARITIENFRTASMDEWQSAFWNLYKSVDSYLPMYDMTLQLVGDSARLAEAVRKRSFGDALPLMAHIFSWLTTMVSKAGLQHDEFENFSAHSRFAEIIWHKYPGICYLCGRSECLCPILSVDDPKTRATSERAVQGDLLRARRRPTPDWTPDGWIDQFDRIYGGANTTRSLDVKAFHFFEEVGEVEVELRTADRLYAKTISHTEIHWEDELADVFSWLTALFLHVRGYVAKANVFIEAYEKRMGREPTFSLPTPTFSEIVWAEFGDSIVGLRCHRCRKTRCDLTVVGPNTRAIDNSLIASAPIQIPRRR